jgi:hypothetical protein
VPVQVALIGEAGGGRGRGDRLAGFEKATACTDAVRQLEGVGGQACSLAKQADEPEPADAGGGGELVETDILRRPVGEVLAG